VSNQKALTIEDIRNFKGKYPKQIWSLFFIEMWERFCFYGMRGMLIYFMVNQLTMDEETANLQYGSNQAFVYAFTFIGGIIADKILGFRKSLFWGALLMITGSIILSIDPREYFYLGTSFIIIGTGFFKPNISAMVGKLYHEGDYKRDAGFSLFYSGINIGALVGGYLCIAIGKGELFSGIIPAHLTWNFAFGLAGIVMVISLITFLLTKNSLADIGLSPLINHTDKKGKIFEYSTYIISLLIIPVIITMVSKTEYTDKFMYTIGPLALVYIIYEMRHFSFAENKKLIAALVFIFFSILFWAFFEQSGGSLSLFASNNLSNSLFGLKLDPNGVNNSANSLFIIIFAPLIGLLWIWMNKRKIEPNTVIKFGIAFLFVAVAFYVFYSCRFFADTKGISSLEIFTLAQFIITFGELCLSPIGLSIMTKLSPQKIHGIMMGIWFLASAYGQYAAGLLGAGMTSPNKNASASEKLLTYTDGYKQLAIYALIAGIILILISSLVRKAMQEVK
jgi:proton-dependent oligopeptide transporter, POT family